MHEDTALSDLSETLARVSQREHAYTLSTFQRIASNASHLDSRLARLENKIRQQKLATEEALEAISSIRTVLREITRQETERLRMFLERRRASDTTFSVCLFGRTNAGKSTLREAITGGDGSTIGQGEQRTTQEVTTYDWSGIQLLDTPGLAAFDGSDDESTAWEAIDRTDLVLFTVSSDSIQMSESEQFLWLRDRNKPVLFVLNVKQDVEHPIRRRRFLKQKTDTISLEGQSGHVETIRERSRKYLGRSKTPVVPIHAYAAYLARNGSNIQQRDALKKASRIDHLLNIVKEIAQTHGSNYRIQAYRDELSHALRTLRDKVDERASALAERLSYERANQEKLEEWFDDFEDRATTQILSHIRKIFEDKLYSEINILIDGDAGHNKTGQIFRRETQNVQDDIIKSIEKVVEPIVLEAKSKIEEHIRQSKFTEETLSLDFETSTSRLNRYVGRTIKSLAAIKDIAITTVFTAGISKLMGSLTRVPIWLLGMNDHYHKKYLIKSKQNLHKQVFKKEQQVKKTILDWFDDAIADPFKSNVKGDIRSILRSQERALRVVEDYQKEVEKTQMSIQRKFMNCLIQNQGIEGAEVISVKRVARKQGHASKILVEGATESQVEALSALEESLGESVDLVQANAPLLKQVKQALSSLRPKSVSRNGKGWEVTLDEQNTEDTTEKACSTHADLAGTLLDTLVTIEEPFSTSTPSKS